MPRKNLRPLAGKPLVAWAIEAAMRSTLVSRWVVSSDDSDVLNLAACYHPDLALLRPSRYAADRSPAIEYVRHALEECEANGKQYEAILILQPSSPLTLATDIDETLQLLFCTEADTAVSVMKLDHALHPAKLKVMEGDHLLPYVEDEDGRMAAHELPDVYVRNCSVYATRRHVIDGGRIIGDDCRGYVMPRDRSVDINEEIDLQFAEFLISHKANT